MWPWKLGQGHQNLISTFPYPQQCIYPSLVKIHLFVQKITHRNHILDISSAPLTTNQLFSFPQQCIYASLVKVHQLVQKIMQGKESRSWHFWTFQSAPVTKKIRSRSQKSNQFFPSSQQCIYPSLVKIHQLVQKIMHRCTQKSWGRRDQHQKEYIPHPRLQGHNYTSCTKANKWETYA